MSPYLSISRKTPRAPMVSRTRVMRFSFDLVNGPERIGAHWVDDDDGITHRQFFLCVSEFKTWLVTAQGYGQDEADAVIAQLCRLEDLRTDERPMPM